MPRLLQILGIYTYYIVLFWEVGEEIVSTYEDYWDEMKCHLGVDVLQVGTKVCWVCVLGRSGSWRFHPPWVMVLRALLQRSQVWSNLVTTLNHSLEVIAFLLGWICSTFLWLFWVSGSGHVSHKSSLTTEVTSVATIRFVYRKASCALGTSYVLLFDCAVCVVQVGQLWFSKQSL